MRPKCLPLYHHKSASVARKKPFWKKMYCTLNLTAAAGETYRKYKQTAIKASAMDDNSIVKKCVFCYWGCKRKAFKRQHTASLTLISLTLRLVFWRHSHLLTFGILSMFSSRSSGWLQEAVRSLNLEAATSKKGRSLSWWCMHECENISPLPKDEWR